MVVFVNFSSFNKFIEEDDNSTSFQFLQIISSYRFMEQFKEI